MSFNLSQLGQIAQGEGSKKPGPKPRMAMAKKKKKKDKKKSKNVASASPPRPEPTRTEANAPPVLGNESSSAVPIDEGPSCSPPLPPCTPQDAEDLLAPVTQPTPETPREIKAIEIVEGNPHEQDGISQGDGGGLSKREGSGEGTSYPAAMQGGAFNSGKAEEFSVNEDRASTHSTVARKRKNSAEAGRAVEEGVSLKGESSVEQEKMDSGKEDDESLPEKLTMAPKTRKKKEKPDLDAKASKKSKKRKSKDEGTESKAKKKRKAKKKPEKAADGEEQIDDGEEPSGSKSPRVEEKKKPNRMSTRQKELERLLAVKDISTLPLCDIVARVNYEELRNKKKEALKKKEREKKKADEGGGSQFKAPSGHARGGLGFAPPVPQQVLAPQVTVVDGKIVLNQESLEVAGKGAAAVQHYERVEEGEDRLVNHATYSNWTKPKRWTVDETHLFYQCVKQFGTDFTLLETLMPGRTRQQLREKYKRECKKDPLLFHQKLTPGNVFDEDFGMEDQELYQKLYEDLKSKRNEQQSLASLPAPSQTQATEGEKSGKEGESNEAGKDKEASEKKTEIDSQNWGQGNQDYGYSWDNEEDYFY
ncbi:hypothetical protein BSKO_09609 [Bryopsis sp. KO-2023]|nr:hypothetical protein BSKO_09609 [Bryopsis sp. KO-2023]